MGFSHNIFTSLLIYSIKRFKEAGLINSHILSGEGNKLDFEDLQHNNVI